MNTELVTTDGVRFSLPFIIRNVQSLKLHSRELTRALAFRKHHRRLRRHKKKRQGRGEEGEEEEEGSAAPPGPLDALSEEENVALLRAAQRLGYQELIDSRLSRLAAQDTDSSVPSMEDMELYMKWLRPAFQSHV